MVDPRISFVATSRNDDHGEGLLRRMQAFVKGLLGQCKRHHLAAELILVEWNPPSNRPRFAQALKWPADPSPCQVRIIEVPNTIHLRFKHAEALPLFQMIAKNVGIRRARGQFVLATNIDILFSDELMRFLAAGHLEPGRMHRIDRWDVKAEVPEEATVDEQLVFCRANLIRINSTEGTFPLEPSGRRALAPLDIALSDSGFRFGKGWYPAETDSEGKPFRYVHNDAELLASAPPHPPKGIKLLLEPGPGVNHKSFRIQVLDAQDRMLARGIVRGRHWIHLGLPLEAENEKLFRLRVEGGGLGVPHDTRIFNFRVFEVGWSEVENFNAYAQIPSFLQHEFVSCLPERLKIRRPYWGLRNPEPPLQIPSDWDIVDADSEIELGENWYAYEYADGRFFRWVDNDAQILIHGPTGSRRTLELEVEAGPGLGYAPFELELRDSAGKVLDSQRVKGIPKKQKAQAIKFLKTEGVQSSPHSREKKSLMKRRINRLFKDVRIQLRIQRSTQFLRFVLPVSPGKTSQYTFHARGALLPAPRGQRRRNFRVFSCQGLPTGASDLKNRSAESLNQGTSEVRALDSQVQTPEHPLPSSALDEASAQAEESACPANLHTNACGDFTLMSRDDWQRLRGYPELEMFSMHLDSFTCHAAQSAGISELVLADPMRIYHIEHSTGSGWTPEGQAKLYKRVQAKGVPIIEFHQLLAWARQMAKNGPLIENGVQWGLAQEELPETVLG